MFASLLHTIRRTAGRLLRPGAALLLVAAQVITAFGYPVLNSRTTVRACGCAVAGPSATCCCNSGSCCKAEIEVAPEPEPPEPNACPNCKVKTAPTVPAAQTVTWVNVMKAQQCRGDGPLGLFADIPAIPPSVATQVFAPTRIGRTTACNRAPTSIKHIPLDPPPRCR